MHGQGVSLRTESGEASSIYVETVRMGIILTVKREEGREKTVKKCMSVISVFTSTPW